MYRVVWEALDDEQYCTEWSDDIDFVCDQLASIGRVHDFNWIQIETRAYYEKYNNY